MKINVIGAGYVGMSLSVLLSIKHQVNVIDINKKIVEKINSNISPIDDNLIQKFLDEKKLNIKGLNSLQKNLNHIDWHIICTPTDYDEESGHFDTSSVEEVISEICGLKSNANILIKSTVPIGFTSQMQKKYPKLSILFSPEFLREGTALYDNLAPSRIIVGGDKNKGKQVLDLFLEPIDQKEKKVPFLLINSTEAEAIKLFSNTYLAMRVAFFNELDTFAEKTDINSENIINGVCHDPRINHGYNNPSFGYGGYCLPKDTKQMVANYKSIPNNLIGAIVDANSTRIKYIANSIITKKISEVGIYRLTMKKNSENFRSSAVIGVMEQLLKSGIKVYIFEPNMTEKFFRGALVVNDLKQFKMNSKLILANRNNRELDDVRDKVYTRDIFGND